jgi:hypothetical protein
MQASSCTSNLFYGILQYIRFVFPALQRLVHIQHFASFSGFRTLNHDIPTWPPCNKRSDFSGVVSSLLKRHNAGTTQTLPRLSGLSVQKKKLWDQMLPESLHLYRRVGALYYIRSHIFVNPKKSLNYPTTSRKIWGKAPEAQQYYRPGSLLKSYMDLHLLPNKSRPKYYHANTSTLNFIFGH